MIKILDDTQSFINIWVGCDSISEIYTIIFTSLFCSLLVLLSNFALRKLFNKDLLGFMDFETPKWLLWVLGTTTTYLLLYLMGIVNYSIQSIVIVAFTWNVLLENTIKKLTNKLVKDTTKTKRETLAGDDDFDV